jgi:hypothetical protein
MNHLKNILKKLFTFKNVTFSKKMNHFETFINKTLLLKMSFLKILTKNV